MYQPSVTECISKKLKDQNKGALSALFGGNYNFRLSRAVSHDSPLSQMKLISTPARVSTSGLYLRDQNLSSISSVKMDCTPLIDSAPVSSLFSNNTITITPSSGTAFCASKIASSLRKKRTADLMSTV